MPGSTRDEQSDAALMRAIAAGDRSAFEALVARHAAAVRRLAGAMTAELATADDVLQEVFFAAWRGADGFRGEGSARGWLFTITRNAAHRTRRRRAGEPERPDSLETLACDAGWGVAADGPSLERVLEDRERLTRAFAQLAPADREILVLVELEGQAIAEAAQTLGVETSAAKSRLHRARLRLLGAAKKELA